MLRARSPLCTSWSDDNVQDLLRLGAGMRAPPFGGGARPKKKKNSANFALCQNQKKKEKRSTLDLLVVSSKKKTIPSGTRPSLGVRPCCLLRGLHFPAFSCFPFRILPPLGVKEQRLRRPMPSIVSAAWEPYLIVEIQKKNTREMHTPPHCRQWSN